METVKVYQIDNVSAELLEKNPPSLNIIAKAENQNNNYTKTRLEPRVYITPPADVIWEFDMVGYVPPRVDTIHTNVSATYVWVKFPKNVKGIKVYSATNAKTSMLNVVEAAKTAVPKDIEIIKAIACVNTQPIQPTPC